VDRARDGARTPGSDRYRCWVLNNGYTFAGPCREFYVRAESEEQGDWVIELQQPVADGTVSAT
jgi:hypothetical protein